MSPKQKTDAINHFKRETHFWYDQDQNRIVPKTKEEISDNEFDNAGTAAGAVSRFNDAFEEYAQILKPAIKGERSRPVSKKEMESHPKAVAAMHAEWKRLRDQVVWDESVVREWNEIGETARRKNKKVHLAMLFGFCVQKGAELPEGDPRQKWK